MWTIHQFPLCPFSRKVRILLREKGVAFGLNRIDPWKADDHFFDMNHAGRVPVVEETEKGIVLSDSTAICEYFEETVDRAPMINGSALNRAEIRRLVALFEENLFGDVVMPLLHERMKKRLVLREPPDSRIIREAMKLAHAHLDYLDSGDFFAADQKVKGGMVAHGAGPLANGWSRFRAALQKGAAPRLRFRYSPRP